MMMTPLNVRLNSSEILLSPNRPGTWLVMKVVAGQAIDFWIREVMEIQGSLYTQEYISSQNNFTVRFPPKLVENYNQKNYGWKILVEDLSKASL